MTGVQTCALPISETEAPVETTEIINKIPGVHLDEPQETAAANSEQADGNS